MKKQIATSLMMLAETLAKNCGEGGAAFRGEGSAHYQQIGRVSGAGVCDCV